MFKAIIQHRNQRKKFKFKHQTSNLFKTDIQTKFLIQAKDWTLEQTTNRSNSAMDLPIIHIKVSMIKMSIHIK